MGCEFFDIYEAGGDIACQTCDVRQEREVDLEQRVMALEKAARNREDKEAGAYVDVVLQNAQLKAEIEIERK